MKMKRRCIISLLACCLALSAPALAATAPEPLVVAATIFPAADIVSQVAGPHVRVIQILPSGASPHTFDLTPGTIRKLQPVRLVFKIGGVDDWIDGIAESVPRATIVPLHRNVPLLPFHGHGHSHASPAHGMDEFDPHYWLNAANAVIMANSVAAALRTVDAAGASAYEARRRRFVGELARLHAEIRSELARLRSRRLIVFHDGWRYFAAAYGLEITAVFQPAPGNEPSPRDLQALYAVAGKYGIRAVFSEPQLPRDSIEPLAHDLGLKLYVLDPLGGAVAGDTYAKLLRRNAKVIRTALGG